jgi:hypothetical protein
MVRECYRFPEQEEQSNTQSNMDMKRELPEKREKTRLVNAPTGLIEREGVATTV